MPWIVDAVRGEGRIGLAGLVSELNVLIRDKVSGTGAGFALLANVGAPALWRRIVNVKALNYMGMKVPLALNWRVEDRQLGSISQAQHIQVACKLLR